jgi:DNA-binding CsgD family transcriptional regulator
MRMPDRAGFKGPKVADFRPGLRMTDRVPLPEGRRSLIDGDVIQGAVATVALLVMWVIGLSPWLAVPLSVMTYMGIALLRPSRERPGEGIAGTATEHPAPEVMAEDSDHGPSSNGELTGIDAVAVRFGLTRREREILPLLAHRLTDREIAEQLSISHRTAMNHTANILGKLGLESRREVAALIARHAVLSSSVPPHEPE